MQTALHREAGTELPASALNCLPALCSCHLSWSLQMSSWNPISNNRTEVFPHPLELHSYIPISFFTDQLEQLHSYHSGQSVSFGPVKLQGFWVLICMRTDQSGTRSGFSLYTPAPLWLWNCTFPFHLRLKATSTQLELTHWSCLAGSEWSRAVWLERGLVSGPPNTCAVS